MQKKKYCDSVLRKCVLMINIINNNFNIMLSHIFNKNYIYMKTNTIKLRSFTNLKLFSIYTHF